MLQSKIGTRYVLMNQDKPVLDFICRRNEIDRCRPRLGRDFLITAKGLLTDEIRRDLAPLREFEFRQHPTIRAEQGRLDALSKIVRSRVAQILGA